LIDQTRENVRMTRPLTGGVATVVVLLSLLETGCVVPIPLGERNHFLAAVGDARSAAPIRSGVTTRAQVVQKLGEPIGRYDEQSVWEYIEKPNKSLNILLPPIAHGPPIWYENITNYLFLRFDSDGIVRAYKVITPDEATHQKELVRFRAEKNSN
jgi:outer membrane protein assembly factor BamE (lipoprotein component of BamABCDE complex)